MKDGSSPEITYNRNLIPRSSRKTAVNTQNNALCYSHRPKGCQPLLSGGSNSHEKKLEITNALPLPCVSEGKCPFEIFRCDKGHEWRAEPGVPMCFTCPICENNAKIQAIVNQEKMSPYRYRLIEYVEMEKEGFINNPKDLLCKNGWKSKIEVTCAKSHVWKTSVYNLLKLKTWCPTCVHSLEESDYYETAAWFGGKFLGFRKNNSTVITRPSSTTKKPLWRCSLGHVFSQSLKNIRLNPGGKRACSWCPTCRRKYNIEFLWNVELSRNCQDNFNQDNAEGEDKENLKEGKKRTAFSLKNDQRRAKLLSYVNERKGSISNFDDLLFLQGWNSKIRLTCQSNHTWDASLKSLLYNQRWCARCALALTSKDFEDTAKRFNGTYLGLVEGEKISLSDEGKCLSKLRARWKCEKGHEFLQKLSNIRNRKHCSWCQRCREEYKLTFTWD